MFRLYKAAAVISVLMKVYSIASHDRGHINVMLVLQSCTDSIQVMADSSTETFPTSSVGTYDVGNVKFEEHTDIKEEEEEVNVKSENITVSEEVESMDIKDEDCIYSEEDRDGEEEDVNKEEEEDVRIQEEVS